MNKSNEYLDQALAYCELGWSVIPLKPKSKEPLQGWKKNQHTKLDESQIKKIWTDHPDANIGVVLGKISNLIALDIDRPNLFEEVQTWLSLDLSTPVQKTLRGKHYLLKYQDGIKTCNTNWGEIRSDGSYIVVAPSIHPNGGKYEWETNPFHCDLLPFPTELSTILKEVPYTNISSREMNKAIIKQGSRNKFLTSTTA